MWQKTIIPIAWIQFRIMLTKNRNFIATLLLTTVLSANVEGHTLTSAIEDGDVAAVAELLQREGAVRELGQRGADAGIVLRAITSERYRDNVRRARIVAMLIDAGADIDGSAQQWSPLDHAVQEGQTEVIAVLLAKGADRQGHTGPGGLLKLAILVNRLQIAQMLYEAGTRPNFSDHLPSLAAEKANPEMLAWLYKIGFPLPLERGSSEELREAVDSDCGACVAILLDAGVTFGPDGAAPNSGIPWFRYIALSAGPNAMTAFAEHGFPVDGLDEDGNTLLHHAAQGQRIDTVKWLLARGLKVDARNQLGETPLMLAAYRLELNAVRTLLEAKADVSLHDQDFHTAKWHASRADNNDEQARCAVVALMERHGANEYVGLTMPASRYDAELDKDRMSEDVTQEVYERLPMVVPGSRFFRVALKGHPVSRLYAVLPGSQVISLKSAQDFSQLRMHLRTKDDALHFVRFLTSYRPPSHESAEYIEPSAELCRPLTSTIDRDARTLIDGLFESPNVEQQGIGAQATFVIRRILVPQGAGMLAVPVEETVSPTGAYTIRTLQAPVGLECRPIYEQ
jgi:uncharacterized protein